MKFILGIIAILPIFSFGQYATFGINMNDKRNVEGPNHEVYVAFKTMTWMINGQKLTWESQPVKVKADKTHLDTILYQSGEDAPWDTIICNVSTMGSYYFIYNHCCSAFDITDLNGNPIPGSVAFLLNEDSNDSLYLGTFGEAGLIANTSQISFDNVLFSGCRSVMLPNIYPITFSEIQVCHEDSCSNGICLYDVKQHDYNPSFGYTTLRKKLDFLYMPLSIQPLKIIYNRETDSISIE